MIAGHVQVKQHQIHLRLRIEQREYRVQRAGFEQFDIAQRIARRLPQGGAEQWMVVGDEEGGHRDGVTVPSSRHPPALPRR